MSKQTPSDESGLDPDPRFPNRPRHPDLRRLARVVTEADDRSDAGATFEEVVAGVVDPASLKYMAQQRVLRTAMFTGGSALDSGVLGALWVDAFVAGVRFQQEGGHQPGADD